MHLILIKIHLTFRIVSQEIPFSGDSYDMEINLLICKKNPKKSVDWFLYCALFCQEYFRSSFNKQTYSIANYYLLTCIIKHSLSSWGVFLKNLKSTYKCETQKMRKLSLRIRLEFTNSGYVFFKSRHSCSQSTFGSFAFINLNRSLIFNNGSRYGSVTRNMGQLIQV